MSKLTQDVKAETYMEVEALIRSLCIKFHQKYGGRIDDLFSHATELFAKNIHKWDRRRSRLTTFVQFTIWKGFLEARRIEAFRNWLLPRTKFDPHQAFSHDDRDYWVETERWYQTLSDQAQQVVGVILEAPPDLTHHYLDRVTTNDLSFAHNYKQAVTEYLRDLGWSLTDIRQSFVEIGQALKASRCS